MARPGGNPDLKPGPGRPKGSRNKLSNDFLNALYEDFKEFGAEAICLVREEKTDVYLNIIAKVLPKDIQISGSEDGEPIKVLNIVGVVAEELSQEIPEIDRASIN